MAQTFTLTAPFQPTGDQPQAIKKLLAGLRQGWPAQTLLGVTGSGKTFTMANVIAEMNRPTLIISHNKTLAAQLASEFREFFPTHAVDYFVSYYDYYQPEAYVPQKDLYIEKESQINEEIDRLRNAATHDLLTRRDVIIVASVSCIYGVGNPTQYQNVAIPVHHGQTLPRLAFFRQLNLALYQRNDYDLRRGTFRVRGEVVDIAPAYSQDLLRFEFDGDVVHRIATVDPITGRVTVEHETVTIYPGRQFVTAAEQLPLIIQTIRQEMTQRVTELKAQNKLLEAQRIEQRTNFDLEMLVATGYCTGVENYSRFFDFRQSGQPPSTLLDYFPKDFLLFIDESHMTLPQLRAMYEGDRSRKQTLVDYGFRLPSALDNRPLKFEEFLERVKQRLFVSATPAAYELQESQQVVEQLIRPTGLLDPEVTVRPTKNQIDDLLEEIRAVTGRGQRVIVTTLTKRMSEDLTEYLDELKIKVQYLHSDVDTLERLEILRDLRLGVYDVIVGINLLREGLDLPEVSLVAILDADKEGFLRSETALMQVMGRAARHVQGRVIMYADRVTGSMQRAIDETKRRRIIQETYNTKHGITPTTIQKKIRDDRLSGMKREVEDVPTVSPGDVPADELPYLIRQLTEQMDLAAKNLEFEKAAALRDEVTKLEAGLPKKASTTGLRSRGRGKTKNSSRFGRRR
ncbi:MAG: excinuclease ABC subunit UvrB [Candidatus Kerfeldbacteria bacterium]|nr:excinuclease ABC subunit UvrB [Candidatus Kerfeldbacteria bacterium]